MEKIDLNWEKCARLLMLNSKKDLEELTEFLLLILKNILQTPEDPKYRKLKYSNKTFQNRIIKMNGGMEYLIATGFQNKIDEDSGEKVMILNNASLQYTVDALKLSTEWLLNTVSTCIEIWKSRVSCLDEETSARTACCESIINIKLQTTGLSVTGGFTLGDKIKDVKTFAQSFFCKEK
jgi:hypothetical protein